MKSENLMKMKKFGVPVPDFFVLEYGQSLPDLDGGLYAVRSNPFISMAGILDSILNVQVKDIQNAIDKVFASWNSPLAVKYRKYKGMGDNLQMSVIIQKMVFPTVDGGFAGIYHTVDPVTGVDTNGSYVDGEFAENLCLGTVEGKDIEFLPYPLYLELWGYGDKLEKLEGFPQDIEFVYDGKQFWFVQNRAAQLTDIAFFKWALRQTNSSEIIAKFGHHFNIDNCVELIFTDIPPIDKCIGVSGTILEGVVGKDIVVLDGGNIQDFSAVQSHQNIILKKGNINNHFAVEARKGKKNCVIWNNPTLGVYVWIDVQSGCVFDSKPNAVFENELKKFI